MNAVRVTGTWDGEYTYGPGYPDLAGTSVPFRMSLSESWLRRITGYVREDATRGGVPERGLVAGGRKGDVVRFVKTMPVSYMCVDRRLVPLHEWIKEAHGATLGPDVLPHEIRYAGTLSNLGVTMAGNWLIRPPLWPTDLGWIEGGGGSGTWSARRASHDVSAV